MPIVIISSSSFDCRRELAQDLAQKTGYPRLSREDVLEEATEEGIPVGKLEVAVLKAPVLKERLTRLKKSYLAFVRAKICERMEDNNLIYHGRAAHLLLPNVSHVFRVRVLPDREYYVKEVMHRLRLDRTKALEYIHKIDQDIDNWIRVIHGMDPHDFNQYDMVINLEHINLINASTALCAMLELPDLKPTPASLQAMENLRLAALAEINLTRDERTLAGDFRISAESGVLTVTYPPSQAHLVEVIPNVCQSIEGCREVRATMAEANILWIQEEYEPDSESFGFITDLAQRWGAAIDVLRWIPTDLETNDIEGPDAAPDTSGHLEEKPHYLETQHTGGIEDDDVEDLPSSADGGLNAVIEKLVDIGRLGGARTIKGPKENLLSGISRDVRFDLIVVGNIYRSKSHAVQVRRTRELRGFLQERLHSPVIETEDLEARFAFGKKQLAKLATCLTLVVAVYALIFSHQGPILDFLGGSFHKHYPWLPSIGVAVFVPLVAYLYSTVTGLILKWIRME